MRRAEASDLASLATFVPCHAGLDISPHIYASQLQSSVVGEWTPSSWQSSFHGWPRCQAWRCELLANWKPHIPFVAIWKPPRPFKAICRCLLDHFWSFGIWKPPHAILGPWKLPRMFLTRTVYDRHALPMLELYSKKQLKSALRHATQRAG